MADGSDLLDLPEHDSALESRQALARTVARAGCCAMVWSQGQRDHREGVMKVVTLKDIPEIPAPGAAEPTDGYAGPVHRTRQNIIEPGQSANYNCSIVNFSQGCNTGWHVHDCDQILIVTSGSGWVATEAERREIKVGDVAHVKAGERHWHGAKADTTMGHITITLASGKATWG
jgi:quercetin dioxygenase-like cupin family protein